MDEHNNNSTMENQGNANNRENLNNQGTADTQGNVNNQGYGNNPGNHYYYGQNTAAQGHNVQYYNGQQFYNGGYGVNGQGAYAQTMPKKKGMPTWLKVVLIILAVVIGLVMITSACGNFVEGFSSSLKMDGDSNEVVTNFGHDYIGVIYVSGTISEVNEGGYNHQYLLNAIDAMIYDKHNKGIVMYVDTPGGSVFASDELYLKIKEYQETTKRPVYSSMQSMAASGGYYVSASCDKIIANRNCWTGSIGVTLGTMYDMSELLNKLGIKTTTITSGANKAMGSSSEEMSTEQRKIFQALVDEAYEQFTGIVAEGRNMDIEEVKALADGRIYTAQQGVNNGLVDEIGTFEDAITDMIDSYGLQTCQVENFVPPQTSTLRDLLGIVSGGKSLGSSELSLIQSLIDMNGKMQLYYMSEIRK